MAKRATVASPSHRAAEAVARLKRAAVVLAERLAASPNATARWIGRDALQDLKH